MIILGLDPGASGAICSMLVGSAVDGPRRILTQLLSASERDVCDFVRSVAEPIPIHAYLERVSASPGAGVSGMFRFGQSYGALRMLLTAFNVPFDLVNPLTWQKALGCARPQGQPKESQTEHKNRTKARAQQLFPEIKITHAIADALLIAEYGRRLRAGELHKS